MLTYSFQIDYSQFFKAKAQGIDLPPLEQLLFCLQHVLHACLTGPEQTGFVL
jgi:hypothetical protein